MSPDKEPRFFAYEDEKPRFNGPGDQDRLPRFTTLEPYQALFAGVTNETAIGEASVIYLYSSKATKRIRHHIPDTKLIAILRHPVDRAYSRFWNNLAFQQEEPLTDFGQALQAEDARIQANWHPRWHYKQRGFYYVQLKRYFDVFDRDQIHVCFTQDLADAPLGLVQDIFRFLGVDETFEPQLATRYHWAQSRPRNAALHEFLTRPNAAKTVFKQLVPTRLRRQLGSGLRALNATPRPPVPPELRAALIAEYREDILQLEDLIQRGLSEWLR
jgi:hypothetical protein